MSKSYSFGHCIIASLTNIHQMHTYFWFSPSCQYQPWYLCLISDLYVHSVFTFVWQWFLKSHSFLLILHWAPLYTTTSLMWQSKPVMLFNTQFWDRITFTHACTYSVTWSEATDYIFRWTSNQFIGIHSALSVRKCHYTWLWGPKKKTQKCSISLPKHNYKSTVLFLTYISSQPSIFFEQTHKATRRLPPLHWYWSIYCLLQSLVFSQGKPPWPKPSASRSRIFSNISRFCRFIS